MPEILVSLVGHQPIPSLFAARTLHPDETILVCTGDTRAVAERLRDVMGGTVLILPDAYRLDGIRSALRRRLGEDLARATFDVTGGTKPMSLAAYGLAAEAGRPAVYVRSTGASPDLAVYHAADSSLTRAVPVPSDAFTLDEYIRAYSGGYSITGPAKNKVSGLVNEGGRFEESVADALDEVCDEVLAGVKPDGVADQIDLDIVVRRGLHVGVLECKLARDPEGTKPKQGLDQLMQATEPIAFGSHVARILVTGAKLNRAIERLADSRGVWYAWIAYRDKKPLTTEAKRILHDMARKVLPSA